MLTDKTIRDYAAQLASNAPTPGGGSAAALVGALAAALAEMAGNFTAGKSKFAAVEEDIRRLLGGLEQQRAKLLDLTDEDAEAYTKLGAAYAMARNTDEEKTARTVGIQDALKQAATVPFGICECCAAVISSLRELAQKANPNLISDVGCAARLALAAMECGWLNVEINLGSITDESYPEERRAELFDIIMPAAEEAADVWQNVVDSVCGDCGG